jgi:hypothetical protein
MVNSSSDETSVGMYNLGIDSWNDHLGGLCHHDQVCARPGLVSGRDQFEHAEWWCEEGGIHQNHQGQDVWLIPTLKICVLAWIVVVPVGVTNMFEFCNPPHRVVDCQPNLG